MSPDQRRHDGIGFALACVLGSIISTQVGASYAKTLFAWVPPVTAVWLRTGWAAAFLIGLYAFRRRTRRFTTRRPSWREQPREAKLVAIGYGVALIVMNWTFYEAIARLPLGIAVTLEFLGPLTVAIIGSRRPVDVLWVLMAGAGGVLFSGAHYPEPWHRIVSLLPPGALGDGLRAAFLDHAVALGPLGVLAAWGVVLGALAVRFFRWSD